jgi:hypothetical protein
LEVGQVAGVSQSGTHPFRIEAARVGKGHFLDGQLHWKAQHRFRDLEQYKHPCLINDLDFRKAMPVEEEVVGADNPSP